MSTGLFRKIGDEQGRGQSIEKWTLSPRVPSRWLSPPPKMDKYPCGMHPYFYVKMNSTKFLVVFLLKTEQFKAIFEAQT